MPVSTFKLIKHFGENTDYDVSVILPSEGELADRIRDCGIKPQIIKFHRLRSVKRFSSFVKFLFFFPKSFFNITFFIRKHKIGIVHFSDIIDMPFYACGFFGNATCITHLRHCIENACGRMIFNVLSRIFIKKVICISIAVQQYSGLSRKQTSVIYNPGPDLDLFDFQKDYPPVVELDTTKKIIMSAGSLLPVKGHDNFIYMAELVEKERPTQCQFVIVGNVVDKREEYFFSLQKDILSKSLERTVTILTKIPYNIMPAIFSKTYILVHMPNYQEGLGGVVLEAMAMKVPVVAFDSGGIRECFTSGVSGFLIKQFKVKDAAERIIELLDDESIRLKMGQNARSELSDKFSYRKHFSEVEKIYNELH
jgi:glycosyltransferase involved in cell wall biosynthesis